MVVVQDDTNVSDGLLSLMVKSDNEKVTLFDIKQNLNTYYVQSLRNLANVLIDSVIRLTTEKNFMNSSLYGLNEEK